MRVLERKERQKEEGLSSSERTLSICPECGQKIAAEIREKRDARGREGRVVVMEKSCPEHGFFDDVLSTDPALFYKGKRWHFAYGARPENIQVPEGTRCPEDCGLCKMHLSVPSQINIDLTTRCNLHCSFCFANSHSRMVYEPSQEQVKFLLRTACSLWPQGMNGVQFAGGEPTIAPTFLGACRYAKELGFKVVQVATNGLKFTDRNFCFRAKRAGLDGLYLQFDTFNDEVYLKMRGERLVKIKLEALQNSRIAGLWVVFVPTIVKGVNNQEVGRILEFAVENAEIMQGVAFQPVSFTGRLDYAERRAERYTLADLAWDLDEQTGGKLLVRRDFYPLSILNPVSKLLSIVAPKDGKEYLHVGNHPYCGLGTYVLVDRRTNRWAPVTRFFDFEEVITKIHHLNLELLSLNKDELRRIKGVLWGLALLREHFQGDNPLHISFPEFIKAFLGIAGRGRGAYYHSPWKFLLVGGMHFQDNYNYDITNRLMNCCIHYVALDPEDASGKSTRVYPFCAYNAGPCYRDKVLAVHGRAFRVV